MEINFQTSMGSIKGLDFGDYVEFRGIKYANAGRFEYPKRVDKWEGTLDATRFGACCFQHRAFDDDAKVNPFYHKEFRDGQNFTYGEDCQFLNILSPADAKNAPVLVYIHGGSFTGGSSDEQHIYGSAFAKQGIVFVSFNYRLNAFGFAAHSSMIADGCCGNYGLADQQVALEWIINHISEFGGDPKRIILMGQSAGAMSVDIQLSNPALAGKFAGAIMMSGAGLQRIGIRPLEINQLDKFWDDIATRAGVSSVKQLKNVDSRTLYYAWLDACKADKLSIVRTIPIRDGKIVTKLGFARSKTPRVPTIVGVTANDMMSPLLHLLQKKYAATAEKSAAPCFCYQFNHPMPGDDSGSWHCSDMLYAFNTFTCNWRPFNARDFEISEEMRKAFVSFIFAGNPNADGVRAWGTGGKWPMTWE